MVVRSMTPMIDKMLSQLLIEFLIHFKASSMMVPVNFTYYLVTSLEKYLFPENFRTQKR